MNKEKITETPHIKPKEGTHFAPVVLMPGDPLRAKFIAENYLEHPVLVNDVRNMLGFTGKYEGKEVSVMGSGMGIPSISLYVHKLYSFFDVDTVIRVGSAGGLAEHVKLRDVVIAMSASTNSSILEEIGVPGVIAPTADYELVERAVDAAKEIGANYHVGNVYSSDYFYHPNTEFNRQIRDFGVLAVEMEAAGLFLEAKRCHKKALGIMTISDHIFTGEALSAEDRQESFREMMEISLKTAVRSM